MYVSNKKAAIVFHISNSYDIIANKNIANYMSKEGGFPTIMNNGQYLTKVITGSKLRENAELVSGYEKRDRYRVLEKYLYGDRVDKVCVLYGLKGTGKRTLIHQLILNMSDDDIEKTAYIKAEPKDTMRRLCHDLDLLHRKGVRYIFIDEVTLIKDFIDAAALLSDIYAAMGMKIVLSGTDSFGFRLAENQELYDRAYNMRTTFIPYREHSRLLKKDDIDEYIRCGGLLDFNAEQSFRNCEAAKDYIDSAICENIQYSLECCENGGQFGHLKTLHEKNEFKNAISIVIENMNYRFLMDIATRKDFEVIDKESVIKLMMDRLDMNAQKEQKIGITTKHIAEIKRYLKELDLITECEIMSTETNVAPNEYTFFTQPGMRYCQAESLVNSLMEDTLFKEQEEKVRNLIRERILSEVKGRMLEDIVLMETTKRLNPKHYKVFKLMTAGGEFDMVIYDRNKNVCGIYEINHSDKDEPNQYRHLADDEECTAAMWRFGQIVSKTVLYRGKSFETDDGIKYRNVEDYLKNTIYDFTFELSKDNVTMDNGINLM